MRYLKQLDGLRAFAIVAVLFEHFAGARLNHLLPVGAGDVGINLFFTLSGFLITGILLQGFDRSPSRAIAWRDFYIRRFLRLSPLLVAGVTIFALLNLGPMRQSWPWHMFYMSNFYIAFGGVKTVFWTLSVEEQFYLLWPFVIAFAPRKRLLAICTVMFLLGPVWKYGAYLAGLPKVTINVMLPGSLEPLSAGCAAAILSYRAGKPAQMDWLTPTVQRNTGLVALACLIATLGVWWFTGKVSFARFMSIDGLMALVYVWVIVSAAKGFTGPLGKILENNALVYVGKISYGIYVVHNFMPELVERVFGPMPKAAAAPIVLLLTFGIAALSYRFYESPIRALGHKLGRHGSGDTGAGQSGAAPHLS